MAGVATEPRRVAEALRREPLAHALVSAAGSAACHWVGGAVRDCLLGVSTVDHDAIVERDGRAIAGRLAAQLPARLVELGGQEFAAYRLVSRHFVLDLWDRQGTPLETELERRDFTVNALAVGLGPDAGHDVIDRFGGLQDLAARRLRMITPAAFTADPLRVVRAARLAAQLGGFALDAETLRHAVAAAPLLPGVASERVRDELERLFASGAASAGMAILASTGVYPALWTGARLGEPSQPPSFGSDCGDSRCRWLLTFLLLPAADQAERFAAVDHLAARHLLDRGLTRFLRRALAWAALPRARDDQRRFLHALGGDWRAAAKAFAAAAPASSGIVAALDGIATSQPEVFDPPRLLSSEEVAARRGGLSGAALGRVLRRLRDLQVVGTIGSREEALAWLTSPDADSTP